MVCSSCWKTSELVIEIKRCDSLDDRRKYSLVLKNTKHIGIKRKIMYQAGMIAIATIKKQRTTHCKHC